MGSDSLTLAAKCYTGVRMSAGLVSTGLLRSLLKRL